MGYGPANERLLSKTRWLRSVSLYALAALLSVAIVALLLRLWRADLTLPFVHKADAAFGSMWIKGIIDNGWYLTNPHLGAPGRMNLRDYPMADNLHFFGIKLLSYFSGNWAVVLNLYFLLTFPLTTVSALFVFRRFHCGYGPSLVGSLLFSFLPYHFMRGEIHLFLASYYLAPLMIMLILEVFLGLPVFSPGTRSATWLPSMKPVARVFICLLVASAGVYYSFFSCFLLLVAGFSRWYYQRTWEPLLKSVALALIISVATVANLYPAIAYRLQHGSNPQSAERQPIHADVFGLKPVQLLLPITDHRLAFFKRLKARYNEAFRPFVNENDCASLGIMGSFGFLLILGRFLYRRGPRKGSDPLSERVGEWESGRVGAPKHARSHSFGAPQAELQDALAILCLACLFLSTIGGLGSLFALFITPMIRCYNRISVLIAFFSLFTLVLMVERVSLRLAKARGAYLLYGLLLSALLIGGIWDQTTNKFIPPYAWVKVDLHSDDIFIRAIETRLPENAMVFQLPYACFPEQGPIHLMADYDHLRGYLHSHQLRWSYGSIKGRAGHAWLKEVSSQPAEKLVRSVALAGFSGIYIDRAGYADAGVELESKLNRILQVQPLVSPNKQLTFFDLSEYRRCTRSERESD